MNNLVYGLPAHLRVRLLLLAAACMLLSACGAGGGGSSNSSSAVFGDAARGEGTRNSTGSHLTDGNLTAGGEFNQTLPGGNLTADASFNQTLPGGNSSGGNSGDGSNGGSGDGANGGSGDGSGGDGSDGSGSGNGTSRDGSSGGGNSSDGGSDGGAIGGNLTGGDSGGSAKRPQPRFLTALSSRFIQDTDSDGDGIKDAFDLDDDGDLLIEIRSAQELDDLRNYLTVRGNETTSGAAARDCGSLLHIKPCLGYELTANISLAAYDNWIPMGYCTHATDCPQHFNDVFDGRGHTISDLRVNFSLEQLAEHYGRDDILGEMGLFGAAGLDASFRNLRLRNISITSDASSIGTLVGAFVRSKDNNYRAANHNMQNLSLANSYLQGRHSIGGLFGYCRGCSAEAISIANLQITNAGSDIGFVGGFTQLANVTGARVSNSEMSADNLCGGILGSSLRGGLVDAQLEASSLSCIDGSVGGAVGDSLYDHIRNASSHSNVFAGSSNIGGLLGYVRSSSIYYSSAVNNTIRASGRDIGGLAGSFGVASDDLDPMNEIADSAAINNTISSTSRNIGGLAGLLGAQRVRGSYVLGGSIAGSSRLGGLAGYSGGTIHIKDSYMRDLAMALNGPTIFQAVDVGGLFGYFYGDLRFISSYVAASSFNHTGFEEKPVKYGTLLGVIFALQPITDSYWQRGIQMIGDPNVRLWSHEFPAAGASAEALKQPTAATGIFANWGAANSTCMDGSPAWDFGTAEQYPALTCPPGGVTRQR